MAGGDCFKAKTRPFRRPPTSGGLFFYWEKTMISVSKAKRILGKAHEELPEKQVEKMLDQCYALAEVMFEHFKFGDKSEEVKNKNEKFKIGF